MLTNLLTYLEETVVRLPDKTAYSDGTDSLTFRQVYDQARSLGTALSRAGFYREPVVVFMGRHPRTVAAFLGVLYAGCHYVPLDEEMPRHRVELIFQSLNPRCAVCDSGTAELLESFGWSGRVFLYDEAAAGAIDEAALAAIRDKALDIDPAYIVFTSGSTGVPKGVAACHRSVIDYIENLSTVLGFDGDTVFGNQTPLYFDACLKEIYPTLKFGATAYLIPKQLFMLPVKLVEYLNDHRINTICWVVSAMTIVSGLGALQQVKPRYLRTVAFGSEVFPIKQFRLWREALPSARFFNLYGPTEATGMSCYYEVKRDFALDEAIPIGRPFHNTEILLLDENDKPAAPGEVGEICIRGTAVTLGYYNDPQRTAEAFVQNPLNRAYPELIYRTGDLARYDEEGELIFLSRKDYQIKHMGHRIELGEIELIANMMPQVSQCCCVFDNEKKKITLFYVGEAQPAEVVAYAREKLPRYMVPNSVRRLERLPQTPNGKIDRKGLQEQALAR